MKVKIVFYGLCAIVFAEELNGEGALRWKKTDPFDVLLAEATDHEPRLLVSIKSLTRRGAWLQEEPPWCVEPGPAYKAMECDPEAQGFGVWDIRGKTVTFKQDPRKKSEYRAGHRVPGDAKRYYKYKKPNENQRHADKDATWIPEVAKAGGKGKVRANLDPDDDHVAAMVSNVRGRLISKIVEWPVVEWRGGDDCPTELKEYDQRFATTAEMALKIASYWIELDGEKAIELRGGSGPEIEIHNTWAYDKSMKPNKDGECEVHHFTAFYNLVEGMDPKCARYPVYESECPACQLDCDEKGGAGGLNLILSQTSFCPPGGLGRGP